MRYKRGFLQKIEKVFSDLNYKVRYEKGHFKSGHCIVENSNVIVVNKFLDTQGRFEVLLDILSHIPKDFEKLSDTSKKFLSQESK